LPFDDQRFDVVVCQFGVMFFPDKERAYREAHRVLKPGGHFIFSVWDRIADNEFADVITEALAELFPSDPPRFLARTPHGYCDQDIIRNQINTAGFGDVSFHAVDAISRAASAKEPAMGYCQGTPLRNEIESRGGSLEGATMHATEVLAKQFGNACIEGRISALVVMARRPV